MMKGECREIVMTEVRRQGKVCIITGGVNTGKTTRLLSIYSEIGLGDRIY